jgi:uncharacterized protein (TIGR00251 family)
MPKGKNSASPKSDIASTVEELRTVLQRNGCFVIDAKVTPRARTAEIMEVMSNGALKIKVTAAPERGKANQEVCRLLANFFEVPLKNVEVLLGHSSQQKRIRIVAGS